MSGIEGEVLERFKYGGVSWFVFISRLAVELDYTGNIVRKKREYFRITSGNPRLFNIRDESVKACIFAQGGQWLYPA